jgi:hypothetical protein
LFKHCKAANGIPDTTDSNWERHFVFKSNLHASTACYHKPHKTEKQAAKQITLEKLSKNCYA